MPRFVFGSSGLTQGGAVILFILGALFLLNTLPSPVLAQTVTQPLTCTMDNGAAPVTLTLSESSGTSLNPATVPCDGSSHDITVDTSAALTATEPAPGATTRDVFSGGISQISTAPSCSPSCSPWVFTNYAQLRNTYQATPNAQTTWDFGLSAITVVGTVAGATSATGCTITLTGAEGALSCLGWVDYNRPVVMGSSTIGGAAVNAQWLRSGTCSFTQTTGGNTDNCNYYKQWLNQFDYSVAGGGVPSAPHLFCKYLGALNSDRGALTTSLVSFWCDSSSSAASTDPSSNSGGIERWSDNAQAIIVSSGGAPYTFNYYHQFLYTLSYTVTDGGSPLAPTLTSTRFGSTYAPTISMTVIGYWLDSSATCFVTNPAGGSTTSERWATNTGCPDANGPQTIAFAYYHQYSETLNYSVVGGGSPAAPTASGMQFGSAFAPSLKAAATTYWFDATGSIMISVPTGTTGERWMSPITSFLVSKEVSLTIALYHQFLLQLSYSVLGGGSGFSPPYLSFFNFSKPVSVPLSSTSVAEWADAGVQWSATNPLPSSSSTERWETNQTSSALVSVPVTSSLTYYHQFYTNFQYQVVGGGAGYSVPSVTFTEFGKTVVRSQGWADSGSQYAFTNPLNGSSFQQRWYTGSNTGVISGAANLSATYFHQYAFVLSYTVIPSGTGYIGPSLNYTALGGRLSQTLAPSSGMLWLDSGTKWWVNSLLGGSSASERWAADQVNSGSATSASTIEFVFYGQYYITVAYVVVGGGSPQTPNLAYSAFGESRTVPVSNSSRSLWVDTRSTWSMPSLLPGSNAVERWIANGTISAPVVASSSISVTYLHQSFLLVTSNSGPGGVLLNSTRWYNQGAEVNLNASAAPGWKFVYWIGVGAGSYNGTDPSPRFALGGPASETAIFYPGLTIATYGGGYVTYSAGRLTGNVSGVPEVIYLPLGANVSLRATPTIFNIVFAGWSGASASSAEQTSVEMTAPLSINASFKLDYGDEAVIAVVVPAVVVMSVYVFIVRRWLSRGKS